MLERKEIENNLKYIKACKKYGITKGLFYIIGDTVVAHSVYTGLRVIFNEKLDIIGISAGPKDFTYSLACEYSKMYYNNYVYKGSTFSYPFDDLTIKDISDIADMVDIKEVNHGHSSITHVNGEMASNSFSYDEIKMLSYIKYLDYKIKEYYDKIYELKALGFPVPDIHTYINRHISMIESCITLFAKNENRPFPYDLISYTGSDIKLIDEVDHELYHIISLMLNEKGLEIDKILFGKLMTSNKPNLDLSILVDNICEKLNIKQNELSLKNRRNYENI